MAAPLGKEMARHLPARALRERRRAHPAGDAADALGIRHHVVARTGRERLRHLLRAHECLAELDRRGYLARDAPRTREVVGADRLLDPVNAALVVDQAAAADRIRDA